MMKNQYQELRARQQAELNAFPLIFAFNDKQFEEGMHKLGLTIKDGSLLRKRSTMRIWTYSDAAGRLLRNTPLLCLR